MKKENKREHLIDNIRKRASAEFKKFLMESQGDLTDYDHARMLALALAYKALNDIGDLPTSDLERLAKFAVAGNLLEEISSYPEEGIENVVKRAKEKEIENAVNNVFKATSTAANVYHYDGLLVVETIDKRYSGKKAYEFVLNDVVKLSTSLQTVRTALNPAVIDFLVNEAREAGASLIVYDSARMDLFLRICKYLKGLPAEEHATLIDYFFHGTKFYDMAVEEVNG